MSTTAPQRDRAPDHDAGLRSLAPFDAKLQVAAVRPGFVERPDLVERLRIGDRVAVVSGPAGSGKTTLLAQWAASDPRPFAWLTISEGDNDLAVLTAYLTRALDAVAPMSPELLTGLTAAGADGLTVLLPRLGRALYELPEPIVLVIDDAHLLTAADCRRALTVLAEQLPAGSQLALGTREAIPLPTGRLRAQRELVEVDAADLALDAAAGKQLLELAGLKLDDATSATIVEQTEGWAAGLYLAALTLRATADPVAAASGFSGDDRVVAAYLRRELLETLPEDVVQFLRRSSILDELSGPRCDAVLERRGSQARLEELEASNLFVVPLDRTGEQFRYHHLFADLLRLELRRAEPDLEPELHRRASRWYEANDDPGRAVRHAYEGGDVDRAAELVWRATPPLVGRGRTGTVRQWLDRFTLEEIATRPPLALAAAWCAVTATRTEPVGQWLELARHGDPDARLPDGVPLGSMIAMLDAVAGERGIAATAASAAAAYALDVANSPFRSLACYVEGTARRLLGQSDVARARLEEGVERGVLLPPAEAGCLAELALLAVDEDDWGRAAGLIERGRAVLVRHNLTDRPPQALLFATSALVLAHHGRPEAPADARHSRRLLTMLNHVTPWTAVEARVVLARAELLLGDLETAAQLAREGAELLQRYPGPGILRGQIDELTAGIVSAAGHSGTYSVPLTTAELRVLRYLPTHLSFQAMADELFVSRNTVKTQAIAIYRKLGVSSRSDAVARAVELGLLEG